MNDSSSFRQRLWDSNMTLSSSFRQRLWVANHIGSVRKMDGHYVIIPLYHRRPPEPFMPRLTRLDKFDIDRWLDQAVNNSP